MQPAGSCCLPHETSLTELAYARTAAQVTIGHCRLIPSLPTHRIGKAETQQTKPEQNS
jgi:hypothetical protein